ncbi:hypothetical protein QCA50_012330 [Cerrena zonata]|uniref:Uncharacterized protein n=1 Tax=Cerrena zonata TaxID=2478898 RepID=A0AAW0FRW4_9APHY
MALAVKPSSVFVKAAGIEKVMETMHDTISVTKKCCCGCFLLGEVLLEKRQKKFNLFGTHARVFPWMPPADLDEDILQTLKDRFVSELQRAIR